MQVLKARAAIVKSQPDIRYVFGPLYPPGTDFLDAHNEWSDSDELQQGLHSFMKTSREIRLQHSRHVIGEAVEGVSWPQEATFDLTLPTGEVSRVTLPAGTTYLGAIIQPQFWPLYKTGKLRAWSMGGLARRIDVDLDEVASKLPDDLQIVQNLGKSLYHVISSSTGEEFAAYPTEDEARNYLLKQSSRATPNSDSATETEPFPSRTPDPDQTVRSIAAKLGMGHARSETGAHTFVSPTTRYSTDVQASHRELMAAGYSPLRSSNNWTNGGHGISSDWLDSSGNTLSVTHHTPESYHHSEGRKSVKIPENARRIRLSTNPPGAGMAPMGASIPDVGASAQNISEGVYGGQSSLIAGAPPF